MAAFKSLRQENLRFEASKGCKTRLSLPPTNKHTRTLKRKRKKKRKAEDLVQGAF